METWTSTNSTMTEQTPSAEEDCVIWSLIQKHILKVKQDIYLIQVSDEISSANHNKQRHKSKSPYDSHQAPA